MNPIRHAPAQGLISRADLLRLLASAPRPALLLDDDGEHQFAYRQKIQIEPAQTGGTINKPQVEKATLQSEQFKLPLQMPFVHVIAERQSRERLPEAENVNQPAPVYEPISEADAQALSKARLVQYQDLVPKARLLPALKRYLSTNRSGGLDTGRLVKQIAGQQLPRHLPRRQLKTWHPQWVVVLDFAKRLWPYRMDMHRLAEHLLQVCGQFGVSIRILNHGPLQHWTDWIEEQRAGGAYPDKHPWRMPPADTPVLLVSDLGLLEGPDASSHQAWQVFIQQLGKAQIRPLGLLPLGAEQLDRGLPCHLTVLRWSPDARMHPERVFCEGQAVPEGIKDLLAMAAVTRRVDPPLLRAMRQLNPQAPLNAGLEGAFWCHVDVEAGSAANLRQEKQGDYQAHFVQLIADCQGKLEELRYQHHAHLRAVLNHEESLLWAAHAKPDATTLTEESRVRLRQADRFMRQLTATLTQSNSVQQGGVWWQVAQDLLQRADRQMGESYAELFRPLVAVIVKAGGDRRHFPEWVDPADLVGDDPKTHFCWLIRDPRTGSILLQPSPPAGNQCALTEPLLIDQGGLRIDELGSRSRLLAMQDLPYHLCGIQEEALIKLTTSQETMALTNVTRPRGALAWGCDESGIWVKTPECCGQGWRWHTSDLRILKNKLDDKSFRLQVASFKDLIRKLKSPSDLELLEGQIFRNNQYLSVVDFELNEYGVLAKLDVISENHYAELSFRWIELGTFLMGSPTDEAERSDQEGPQHLVTISKGFWLADTACTQALWQAVMDNNNPSRFKDDPQLPVEQVSWRDVQQFLQRLQALLPGCQVDLPSDAEWEYACRAGTNTPFSFGVNITPQQVNYHGEYPYAKGEKGEYRGKTVPVKSLPANAWGLYEMHGNVDEWCKDGRRNYSEDTQIDPLGSIDSDEPRVVRGGSWRDGAGWARSALRYAILPGDANGCLGFRVCLRSIESGQEAVSPAAVAPGWASEASPDAEKSTTKSSKASYISKLGSLLKPKPKR